MRNRQIRLTDRERRLTIRPINRQTKDKTGRQTIRKMEKQIDYTDRQTKQTEMQTDKQTGRQKDKTGRQTTWKTEKQIHQTDRQTKQTDRQTDKQTNRMKDKISRYTICKTEKQK